MMPVAGICPSCGAEVPSDAPRGFCPRCLYQMGFEAGAEPEPAEARDLTSIRQFGDYELLAEIGHGGMGVVYKARQKSLDRIVALKMLLFGPHAPPASVKRFRAEAVATAAMHHPGIVAIHEVGFCEGQHYIAMDCVEGQSLSDMIRSSPLPARRAAGYAKAIADAIHYAHEHGILHRDLKPGNVLIDSNDQPRVTDFGLAKRLQDDSDLTVTGQVLGSPNYMPPEQATGKRGALSRRSDVYALGAILYDALTGRPPFAGESVADTVHQVLNSDPISPRVLNPRVPADLETVCLTCLEKDPVKRYATAQMLAEELGRFLDGQPVLARPIGPVGKLWRWCRRNPALAGTAAAAVLAVTFGFTGVLWQLQRVAAQRLRAERNAYAADMKEVQRALDDSDVGRARELLERHRPGPSAERGMRSAGSDLRGWEWRYLWGRCQGDELRTLCRYRSPVSALAFSPDGKWLAVRHTNLALVQLNGARKRPLPELPTPDLRWCTKALAFSSRESLLAWDSYDREGRPVVNVRNLDGPKETRSFPHPAPVRSVAFAPDTAEMATLADDGIVRVWDRPSRQLTATFPTVKDDTPPRSSSPTTGETPTATALPDPRLPKWQQVRTGLARSVIYTDHYGSVLFSPDGRWLAIGEVDAPRIRLLDRVTGKEEPPILGPPLADGISALAFSPDGTLLAAGCGVADNDVRVWDLRDRTERRLTGHSGWVTSLAFSPNGQTLASASADQTIRLWEVARKAEPYRLQGSTDEVWALAWSPEGKDLVTGGKDGSVRTFDAAARPRAPYLVLPEAIQFWGGAFLPDSKTFLTVTGLEGGVVRRETATAQATERLTFLGTNHTSLELSADGRWLALGDAAGNVRVWDWEGRQMITNLVCFPQCEVFALFFSPRGTVLVGAALAPNGDVLAKFWVTAGWREMNLQDIALKDVCHGAFSPDERVVALAYFVTGTAVWWDLKTGRRLHVFEYGSTGGAQAAFSPDGRWFATGGLDGALTVWDTATRRPRSIGRGYRNGLQALVFSPDSRRLVASGVSPKGLIKVWDVDTGRDVATLPGEPGRFSRLGFSPDGNSLFAASTEGTGLLWHAPSFAEIEAREKNERTP